MIAAAASVGKPMHEICEVFRREGPKIFSDRPAPSGAVAIARDITRERHDADRISETNRQLRRQIEERRAAEEAAARAEEEARQKIEDEARRKAEAAMQEKMMALTGGLGLPPGFGPT